jgi:hypothetical protein
MQAVFIYYSWFFILFKKNYRLVLIKENEPLIRLIEQIFTDFQLLLEEISENLFNQSNQWLNKSGYLITEGTRAIIIKP